MTTKTNTILAYTYTINKDRMQKKKIKLQFIRKSYFIFVKRKWIENGGQLSLLPFIFFGNTCSIRVSAANSDVIGLIANCKRQMRKKKIAIAGRLAFKINLICMRKRIVVSMLSNTAFICRHDFESWRWCS